MVGENPIIAIVASPPKKAIKIVMSNLFSSNTHRLEPKKQIMTIFTHSAIALLPVITKSAASKSASAKSLDSI